MSEAWVNQVRSDVSLPRKNAKALLECLLEDPEFYSMRIQEPLSLLPESERTKWFKVGSHVAQAIGESQ
jgi:hypothetical protein